MFDPQPPCGVSAWIPFSTDRDLRTIRGAPTNGQRTSRVLATVTISSGLRNGKEQSAYTMHSLETECHASACMMHHISSLELPDVKPPA